MQDDFEGGACTRSAMARGHLTFVDLFAGAGMFAHAFQREGCTLVHAVELEQAAARTHAANHPNARIEIGDVTRLRPSGRCDLLIAGPPCQGFSTLNQTRANDPRNKLSLEVARWAHTLQPQIIVIENVAPFLVSTAFVELSRRLRRMGYEVEATVLNAVDFGVAQHRLRSFTFASRIGLPTIRPRRRAVMTVREAWHGLAKHPNGENSHYAPRPSELALRRMKVIPRGGDKRDILRKAPELAAPSWQRVTTEVTDVWGRLDWDAPANTLRTCLLNPSKGRYIHPEQHRVISLREAARLHSIPDSYRLIGTPYQIARQIGNSVPPRLGRAVARAVVRLAA